MYQSGFEFDGQLSVETAIQKGHLKKKTWITHLSHQCTQLENIYTL